MLEETTVLVQVTVLTFSQVHFCSTDRPDGVSWQGKAPKISIKHKLQIPAFKKTVDNPSAKSGY